jgi:iron(III) transport system ATP-binding protein
MSRDMVLDSDPQKTLQQSESALRIQALSHRYSPKSAQILTNVELDLKEGQIAGLLGPSGSGKSTLLRCIAGFEQILEGEIFVQGERMASADGRIHLDPGARKLGMVFQDFALFPNLSARENIQFGLKGKKEKDSFLDRLIEILEVGPFLERYPHQLSGGQQQRVAIARALAPKPKLLLLDEPFSNVDPSHRARMGLELKNVLKELKVNALFVTHDQNDAFDMADEVGLLKGGRMIQWGSPVEVYHHPNSIESAQFFGKGSFLKGRISQLKPLRVETELGRFKCPENLSPKDPSRPVQIFIRPEHVHLDSGSSYKGKVREVFYRGLYQLVLLEMPEMSQVLCLTDGDRKINQGEIHGIRLDDHALSFFAPTLA